MFEAAIWLSSYGSTSSVGWTDVDREFGVEVNLRLIIVVHFDILNMIWRLLRRTTTSDKINKRLRYFGR